MIDNWSICHQQPWDMTSIIYIYIYVIYICWFIWDIHYHLSNCKNITTIFPTVMIDMFFDWTDVGEFVAYVNIVIHLPWILEVPNFDPYSWNWDKDADFWWTLTKKIKQRWFHINLAKFWLVNLASYDSYMLVYVCFWVILRMSLLCYSAHIEPTKLVDLY